MMDTPTVRVPGASFRRLARFVIRSAALTLGRTTMTKRHLLRLRFGEWAPRWLGGPAIVRWRGVRVEVDPGEAHGFHVFAHGDYGGAELDACIDLCRGARIFVDVGAHIGLVSLAVARACPSVRVVAVEANDETARWFQRNLTLNPDLATRVTLLQAAAADHDGEVGFAVNRETSNVGTGHVTTEPAAHDRRVRAVRLGHWLAAHGLSADVVKMDVEGGELPALAGLWSDGTRPVAILLETHGHLFDPMESFNRQVVDDLARQGYRVDYLERGSWTPISDPNALGARSHLRARVASGARHT